MVKNRSCICVNKYVSTNTNQTILNYIVHNNPLEQGHYSFIDVNTPIQKLIKESCGNKIKQCSVYPELLMNILDNNNAPKNIEYLSIDIEGLDFEILQTIDFSKYIFKIITIEEYIPNINTVSDQSILITKFLKQHGYKMIGRLSQDLVYINEET